MSTLSYTPDEILLLAPAIQRMGGALLPETCEGRIAAYPVSGSKKTHGVKTTRCGEQTMYVIPYEPVDADKKTTQEEFRARGAGYARVCVHDDLMGSWPNFENVLESNDE